jgi:hypothetical protein
LGNYEWYKELIPGDQEKVKTGRLAEKASGKKRQVGALASSLEEPGNVSPPLPKKPRMAAKLPPVPKRKVSMTKCQLEVDPEAMVVVDDGGSELDVDVVVVADTVPETPARRTKGENAGQRFGKGAHPPKQPTTKSQHHMKAKKRGKNPLAEPEVAPARPTKVAKVPEAQLTKAMVAVVKERATAKATAGFAAARPK